MMNNPCKESFTEFFKRATAGFTPYEWQTLIATEGLPDVLAVPTGLGKTEVVLAWAWRLLVDGQPEPRHLVYCLPMRSLVTQTVKRLKDYFDRLKQTCPFFDVKVYQLMGGAIDDEWASQPDKPWVLVGTQDQLLSRALNRGYAMRRFDWPVHFGLLNNDCRWLIDEVQLMGPGLWTTAQLDWMRQKRFLPLKPCLTTWMSATVGTAFLETEDRKCAGINGPSQKQVTFENKLNAALNNDNRLNWWKQAKRPLEWWTPGASKPQTGSSKKRSPAKSVKPATITPEDIATFVKSHHVARTLTLVICNTVELAQDVFRKLDVEHKVLLTSRFRGEDRTQHEQRLIEFDADRKTGKLTNDPGLICVSTQVIEAGIDISAHRLFTELAPWPSMLQRLGRLNRKGDDKGARGWVWETPEKGGNNERIGPYEAADIELAKELVDAFIPFSQQKPFSEAINDLNQKKGKQVTEALQPKESPLPRALDVHGLFSTEPDVHGGFTDISAFVRGMERDPDVTVFWRDWSGEDPPSGGDLDGPLLEPKEGCPVSFIRVQEFLKTSQGQAWLWNDETGCWEPISPESIRPGMLVMLKRDVGGYDKNLGWTGNKSDMLAEVPRAGRSATLGDDTRTEAGYWSKLTDHLEDAKREAEELCNAICLQGDLRKAVVEAAALHDLGKAHPQWQNRLPTRAGIPGKLLAKCPRVVAADVAGDASAVRSEFAKLRPKAYALPDEQCRRGREEVLRLRWAIDDKLREDELKSLRSVPGVRWVGHLPFRPGLRHEVASALAMWWKYRKSKPKPYPALAVYLAAAHHGKVRTVMRSITDNGDDVFGVPSTSGPLTVNGNSWTLDFSVAKDGAEGRWEGDEFVLTGYGWTGLVADLLGPWRPEEKSDVGAVPEGEPRHLGPFALAYLEALVRIADWRASDPSRATGAVKPSEVRNGC
jgi:CRISPR-associated endonuclease/helicase Cas3